jgi:hypothetical protein
MRIFFVLMALIAFGSTAACGGSDEPGTQENASREARSATPEKGEGKKACDLFTTTDVEAFFGAPAEPLNELNHATQCSYHAPETGIAGVTLSLSDGDEFSFSWASDQMRSTSEVEDLAGLGEAAVWIADMSALVALDRDRTYILMGGGSLDTKRQLMQRILDRL